MLVELCKNAIVVVCRSANNPTGRRVFVRAVHVRMRSAELWWVVLLGGIFMLNDIIIQLRIG